MNAKYGKLSIGCFILCLLPTVWIAWLQCRDCPSDFPLILVSCIPQTAFYVLMAIPFGGLAGLIFFLLWSACIYLGIRFASRGRKQQESPPYFMIGYLLFFGFFFLQVLFVIILLFHR